ncbi:hypothetical protein M405DRAFT_878564 [Rhizopogon salebrosus TDB-379]|nr:hypothetical protein M405DRAFT_878564 [Rhizopogon salebrosus TDB-379]
MERLGVTNVSAITLVQEAQRIELEFRQGDATTAAHHLEPPNSSSMYAAENHSAVTHPLMWDTAFVPHSVTKTSGNILDADIGMMPDMNPILDSVEAVTQALDTKLKLSR